MGGRQLDVRRLVRVAALFESPIPGERDAALTAFSRLLAAGGKTWADLLEPLHGGCGEEAAHKVEGRSRTSQQLAADLAREAGDALTEWEVRFLHGCTTFRQLSPKQLDTLAQIQRKVERAAAP